MEAVAHMAEENSRTVGQLADTISQGADYIEIGGVKKHVISYLGDFLFPPERARSPK